MSDEDKTSKQKLTGLTEALLSLHPSSTIQINLSREEYPDKLTWGKADSRKELRFDASDLEGSKVRLKNVLEIAKLVSESEKGEST